jgi:predicted dehydrogenase
VNRVALIGCGTIAENGHLPVLLEHPRFAVAAVCDERRERAELLASRAGGVPSYVDWRELLEHEDVDVAVLALPPETSPEIAVDCLGRGLHVLDEKPLAATVEAGRRLARVVAESAGVYQVGFVLRFGDLVREVSRLSRAIGTPSRTHVAVFDERLDRAEVAHLERIKGFLRNSSAMTHEGSHVIDYAGLWNPSPWARVRAVADCTEADFEGPNLWHATIDLSDGSVLEVEIGWLLPEIPRSFVTIEGPNGRLDLDIVSGVGRRQIEGDSSMIMLSPMVPEWSRQYDAFARAIQRGKPEVATVEDGLRALEVTAACEEARRTGAEIARREFRPSRTHKKRSI